MQVHRQNAAHAHALEHVGNDLGGNGHACGTRTAILASVSVIGHHGRNATRGSAAQGIDHNHDFHQVVVCRRAGALHDKHVRTANVFIDFHHHFPVGEAIDSSPSHRNVQILRHGMGKLGIGITGENFHVIRTHCGHDRHLSHTSHEVEYTDK